MNPELRAEAIGAVHDMEAVTVEPSVEQYVDAVLGVVAARLAAVWDEGWDEGHRVGYVDAIDPDAPSLRRHNPYPAAVRADPSEATTRD